MERHLLSHGRRGGRKGRTAGFDELAFYAEHFDTVEVNSTFYGVPAPNTTKSWVDAYARELRVLAEALSEIHPSGDVPPRDGTGSVVDRHEDVDGFRRAIDPIAEAGKLGALLAQFPASFKNEANARGYLEWLLQAFKELSAGDRAPASELQRRSRKARCRLLSEHGAALVQIDEPKFRLSIRQNLLPNVKTFYYMRLHGRNADTGGSTRSPRIATTTSTRRIELEPFADAAEEASRHVKKAYLYTNNHFSAKSVANAATIKSKLGQPLPGEYPESFVERYPTLKGLVRILPPRPSDTLV